MKRKVTEETVEEQKVESPVEETSEKQQVEETKTEITEAVDKVLKNYPQYEECYVDKNGFVYPKNAPEYQRKDAVLYKNKYYKS